MLAIGATAVALSFFVFRRISLPFLVVGMLLLLGSAALPFVPIDGLYLPELWAGIFLLLSILAYALRLGQSRGVLRRGCGLRT